MEPNFIRPVMSGYLAKRTRDTHSVEETALAPVVSPALRLSPAARIRLASGKILISLGERVAGAPRPAYNAPANDAARVTS